MQQTLVICGDASYNTDTRVAQYKAANGNS